MREIILIIILIATLSHTTYTQRRTIPTYKARIAELEKQVESAPKESSKKKVKETVAEAPPVKTETPDAAVGAASTLVPAVDAPPAVKVEDPAEARLRAAALKEAEKERREAAIAAIDARVQQARETYQAQADSLDAQIQRGRSIREATAAEKPKFREHSINLNQERGGIRTSEADRKRWYDAQRARLDSMDAALVDMEARRDALERAWEQTKAAAAAERAAVK